MSDMPTLATAATTPSAAPPAAPAAVAAPATPASAKPPAAPDAPRGSYEQRRHAQEQATAADAPPASADKPAAPPAAGEKFKVGTKYEISEDDLGAMMQRQAVEDQRKLTLPASPEAYKAELPADLKLPGGVEYKLDPANPSLAAARNMAHSMGLSQDQFSQILGVYASHEAGEQAALAARSAAEVAKAGINAGARVDAVGKFITGLMGEADAKQIRALVVTDSMLRYHELIMQKLSSQGAASFSQSHRAAPDTGIPGWEKMTFEQRRYAQEQVAARRR